MAEYDAFLDLLRSTGCEVHFLPRTAPGVGLDQSMFATRPWFATAEQFSAAWGKHCAQPNRQPWKRHCARPVADPRDNPTAWPPRRRRRRMAGRADDSGRARLPNERGRHRAIALLSRRQHRRIYHRAAATLARHERRFSPHVSYQPGRSRSGGGLFATPTGPLSPMAAQSRVEAG